MSRLRATGEFGRVGAQRGSDRIVAEQVDRGLLSAHDGLVSGCKSLRSRTFNLCLLLYNRKRLVGQISLLFLDLSVQADTHYIVAVIQSRRIGHPSVHDPSLGVVLGANEIFDFPKNILC